jgi:hypothetical protein
MTEINFSSQVCDGFLYNGLIKDTWRRYNCFSLEFNLLIYFEHYFSAQNESRFGKIFIHHLNDLKKEHILNVGQRIDALFLHNCNLIIFYHIHNYSNSGCQMRIDIYDLESLAKNINEKDSKKMTINCLLSIEVNTNNYIVHDIVTVDNNYCVLQNRQTEHFFYIPYKNVNTTFTKIYGLSVKYNHVRQEKTATSALPKNSWLAKEKLAVVLIFIILFYGYQNNKCPSFLKNLF